MPQFKDHAVVPKSLHSSRFRNSASSGWNDVVDYVVSCLQNNQKVDNKALRRFLLCYGLDARPKQILANQDASNAEDYILNWHMMTWVTQQSIRLSIPTTRPTSIREADPLFGFNASSFAGVSDGYVYHALETPQGLKLFFQHTVSGRLGRLETHKSEYMLLDRENNPIRHAMGVAFDRRLQKLILLEPRSGSACPGRLHCFYLDGHPTTLSARSHVNWPSSGTNNPTNVRMQAAGGVACVLLSYFQRLGNELVFFEYVSLTKPATVYRKTWTPVSFLYRDEENILVLERNPDIKARTQIKLFNYMFASHTPPTTECRVPSAIQNKIWNSDRTHVGSVDLVPQISIPVSYSAVAPNVGDADIGEFYNNTPAAPIAFKFNASSTHSDTWLCHQNDLIAGVEHPQIYAAARGGDQHIMNGMKLISWRTDASATEIRVEDYTDGLGKCALLHTRSTPGLPNATDSRWSTSIACSSECVRSTTFITGGGLESMDVTEDALVLWNRSEVHDETGYRVPHAEYVYAHMYGF